MAHEPRRPHAADRLRALPPRLLLAALPILLVAGWLIGEATRLWQSFDLRMVRDVAAHRSPLATDIARALSRLGSVPVVALIALVCIAALWRARHRVAAAAVAATTAGAGLLFDADKLLVGRPRPPVVHLEAAGHSSFPSGHATMSTAVFGALLIVFLAGRRPGWLRALAIAGTALLVASIAASRVYLGVHYPTDVAAGILLGGGWAALVAASARRRPAR